MTAPEGIWDAFVDLVLADGPVEQCRSRYGNKPAIRLGTREIAHSEAPGCLDIRVTRLGWKQIRAEWADDPAVVKESARSDWLELRVDSIEGLARYRSIFTVMLNLNR